MAENKTYQTLIDSGLALLLEHGFTASGISRIVNAAGVPKGSFYHFFPGGKLAFALAVIARYHEIASAERARQLLAREPEPLTRLRQHFAGYAEGFAANGFTQGCLLGNLSAEVADQMPALRAALQDAFSAWENDVAQVLGEAQSAGDIAADLEPEMLARAMIASWEGALLLMKSHRSGAPLEDFQRVWFEGVLR